MYLSKDGQQVLTEDMKSSVSVVAAISAELLKTTLPSGMGIDKICDNNKVSDHHAIILTKSVKGTDISSLLVGEREILKLIARQTLCAISEPYRYTETTAVISCGGAEFKQRQVCFAAWVEDIS